MIRKLRTIARSVVINTNKLPEIERRIVKMEKLLSKSSISTQHSQQDEKPFEHDDTAHKAIKAVWNDYESEEYRQDQSHYRGIGRWADDEAWQNIGKSTLQNFHMLWQLEGRSLGDFKNLTVLEWGPRGGTNAFALRENASQYFGVDISEKNLAEAGRMLKKEGKDGYFHPIHLSGAPETIIPAVGKPVDLFLSTAVFQHFPSNKYGEEVLRALRAVCSDTALGMIQIRFKNDNFKYDGISSIEEYHKKHITANSYALEVFWDLLLETGFEPVAVNRIASRNNYATFLIKAKK